MRRDARTGFAPDPGSPERAGRDAAGRLIRDRRGMLGTGAAARYVRQVSLEPSGGPVVLVTDQLDEPAYPAEDLLGLYLQRWGIERVYQRVVEGFGLARFIGSSPEATVFQAAYCLALSNLIEAVRGGAGEAMLEAGPAGGVSGEKLFEGDREELTTLHRLVAARAVAQLVGRPGGPGAMRARLAELLGGAWRERYASPPGAGPRAS